jgi:hypothetical protein
MRCGVGAAHFVVLVQVDLHQPTVDVERLRGGGRILESI